MEVFVPEIIQQFGVTAAAVFITLIAAYRWIDRTSAGQLEQAKAEANTQNVNAQMVLQLSTELNSLQNKVIDVTNGNAALRETNAELRMMYQKDQEIWLMKNEAQDARIRQLEQAVAQLTATRKALEQERDKLKSENDRYELQITELTERVKKLEAQVDAYQEQVRLAETQKLPLLEADADPQNEQGDHESTVTEDMEDAA